MRTITRDQARRFMLGQHRLNVPFGSGAPAVRKLLLTLRCIQLDPLDPIGTNADLVALARVDGIARGDVYRHLMPGHAFEHFAKERCILPAYAFPYYRDQSTEAPWWWLSKRLERLPEGIIERVYEEVKEIGPATPDQLTHHGAVEALDWSGWKGTGRATTMALEVLWTQCRIVVCGRAGRNAKLFDIPERALPEVAHAASGDFATWALNERVEAAGLLSRAGGAMWSTLSPIRTTEIPNEMVERGELEEVMIEDSPRRYLAPKNFLRRKFPEPDDRLRILGPLDSFLWDRELIRHIFGFDYVWEVYKPEAQRRWGWYVCPLLERGELVGRIEAVIERETLVVKKLWREEENAPTRAALETALARHATACGAKKVKLPRNWQRQVLQ